ncbi:MAG: GDP-mannose 4,6-dehydratase [Deltaproteobacteria bacterium]|nr:GDP-mannose 4,6-dehydratase [Deltaproteobacteria bacterium]
MGVSHWQDRPVLVTGATGLLGGHLCATLLDLGARVHVLMRDVVPDCFLSVSGHVHRVVQIRGDLADYRAVERAVAQYQVRTVFHLGAQAIVGIARRSPWQTFESNARGSWNLLEACRVAEHVEAIVIASSDKVYGATEDLPYRESHPLGATNPYDVSKAMTDMLARSYAVTYGLPIVTLRCGNLYGPGDLHFDRLIPEFIRARVRGETPVMRSTGQAERDFLWVGDAVDAYVLAAERAQEDGIVGEAFNVSDGRSWTVLAVAELIDELTGVSEPPRTVLGTAEADGEIPRQTLDATLARQRLGWAPSVDLAEGLERTIAWYRQWLASGDA